MLHIIDELEIGGAQTHLETIIQGSMDTGKTQHKVLALFGKGAFASRLEDRGIPVAAINIGPGLERHRYFSVVSQITAIVRGFQPDLVETHLTWSRIFGSAGSRLGGCQKTIGFEHGDVFRDQPKFRAANWLSQWYIDRYVVCSHALKDWFCTTHGVRRRQVSVLHNCVDVHRFSPTTSGASSAEHGSAEPRPAHHMFVAVGTLGYGVNKRMDIAIRALWRLRKSGVDAGLWICGDGPQRADLERLAQEIGVSEHVVFLGMKNDMATLYPKATAFVHCAPFEPFGIVCLEAMASGLPVLVPDNGGMMEAVQDGVHGHLYHTQDYGDLAKRMGDLLSDPSRLREMGSSARERTVARFSVKAYVEQLHALYDDVLSS